MLSKQHRLSRQQFWLVRKSGKKLFSQNFLIYYLPSSTFQASVVVGKKISKKAVKRNQIRRQIHHLLSSHLDQKFSLIIYLQKNEKDLSGLDQVLPTLVKL